MFHSNEVHSEISSIEIYICICSNRNFASSELNEFFFFVNRFEIFIDGSDSSILISIYTERENQSNGLVSFFRFDTRQLTIMSFMLTSSIISYRMMRIEDLFEQKMPRKRERERQAFFSFLYRTSGIFFTMMKVKCVDVICLSVCIRNRVRSCLCHLLCFYFKVRRFNYLLSLLVFFTSIELYFLRIELFFFHRYF